MKTIPILLIIFLFQMTYAQTEDKENKQYIYTGNGMLNVGYGSLSLKTPSKGETQGSMYYYDQFSAVKAAGLLQNFLARYNAYEDRMEFQSGDKIFEYYPNLKDKEFEIINLQKIYLYLHYYLDEERSENGYLVVLQKGENYTLYKKEKIKFVEGRVSQTGYDKTVPDKYIPVENEYYLGIQEGRIIHIPRSKKDFAKLFGKNEEKAANYIKENKLNIKEENEIKKIVIYLNKEN